MNKLLIGVAILISVSCNTGKEHDSHEQEKEVTMGSEASKTDLSVEQASLKMLMAAYYGIKDALVADNASSAAVSAKTFSKALESVSDEVFKSLTEVVQKIQGASDIEVQRAAFIEITENIYALIKNETSLEEIVYVQYCPMANGNKGANWLSNSEEVLNPYFGSKMLKCGSVKEILKAK